MNEGDNCNLTGWRWFLEWWGRRTEDEQFGLGILFTLVGPISVLFVVALLWHIADLVAGMPPH